MTRADIGIGMRLKQAAGWNQTSHDWLRFLSLAPRGCFLAQVGGKPVGTVTSCVFGSVAWIGCLLVDSSHRRMGVATQLMQRVIRHLDRSGVRSIRLDATSSGRPLYEKLGFRLQYGVHRLAGVPRVAASSSRPSVQRFEWSHWNELIGLDQAVSGVDRTKLFKRLLVEDAVRARIVRQGGRLCGFLFDRPGAHARQIGPLISGNEAAGRRLFLEAFRRHNHRTVFVDVPAGNCPARSVAQAAGLSPTRDFLRMCRGQPQRERVLDLWAGTGPEKG